MRPRLRGRCCPLAAACDGSGDIEARLLQAARAHLGQPDSDHALRPRAPRCDHRQRVALGATGRAAMSVVRPAIVSDDQRPRVNAATRLVEGALLDDASSSSLGSVAGLATTGKSGRRAREGYLSIRAAPWPDPVWWAVAKSFRWHEPVW